MSRQGSAACFQITLVKNINSTHRIEGVDSQFGLSGALASARVKALGKNAAETMQGLGQHVKNVLRGE